MTEILTESFCERCGTRYTFETARPQHSRISRARTLTKGIRNFVLSDDPFSVAMADARGEEERAATAVQLDAFHRTFNFCLSCRQYTCGSCWNSEDGRCLSCAPLPETETPLLAVAEPPLAVAEAVATVDVVEHAPVDAGEWPAADLPQAPEVEAPAVAATGVLPDGALAEAASPAEEALAPSTEVIPDAGGAIEAEAPTSASDLPVAPALAAAAALSPAPAPVQGLRPGESLEDALAAYEASLAAEEAATGPDVTAQPAGSAATTTEPSVAAVPEPVAAMAPAQAYAAAGVEVAAVAAEPAAEVEPVPATVDTAAAEAPASHPETLVAAASVVAAPEPEPALAAPAADAMPAAQEEPEAPPAAAPAEPVADLAPAAAAPAAPATPAAPLVAPGWLTVAPDDGSTPIAPYRPAWPTSTRTPMSGGTLAGRQLRPQDDAAALWAASAREVLSAGPSAGVDTGRGQTPTATAQQCIGCGLPLSANARFCRRCGTRQA
jgi:hypothetical protein